LLLIIVACTLLWKWVTAVIVGVAAAVHRMDPGRRKPLNATYNTQNGVNAAE
jgi:hypothetical protein